MEGSVAAPAGAQPGQADGQAQPGDGQQQTPDLQTQLEPLLAPINQQMEETRQFLQNLQQPEEAQEPQQPELPAVDLSAFDETNPQYDPAQAAQQLTDMIDQRAQAQAQQLMEQHVAPLQEAQDEMRRSRDAEALAAKYPDLQKPEVAKQVIDAAHQMAEQLGHPELANNPTFWEHALLNLRAVEYARNSGAESPQAATLEGAGGASPGAQQGTTEQAVDRIFSGGRSNPLPFK